MNYNIVLDNYKRGLWTITQLKKAYAAGVITKEQYKEIKNAVKAK